MTKALPPLPAPAPGPLARAEALIEVGRYEHAGGVLARLLADEPGNAPAWFALARCRGRLGDHPGALQANGRALELAPEHPRLWQQRTGILIDLARYEEAADAAREAVRRAPDHWGSHLALADALLRRRRTLGQAHECARRAVRLAPHEAAAHYTLGVTAQGLGRHEDAEAAYRAALRLNPQDSASRNNLAVLQLHRRRGRRGGLGAALTGFADAVAGDLQDRTARYNLEAMAFGILAGARWPALLTVTIGLTGAAVAGAGQGSPPHAGQLWPRLGALLLIAAVCALWAWRLRRRVPRRLHTPLFLLARRCPPVVAMACGVLLPVLAAVLSVAVPWTDPAFLGATLAPAAWALFLAYWIARAMLSRRRPGS